VTAVTHVRDATSTRSVTEESSPARARRQINDPDDAAGAAEALPADDVREVLAGFGLGLVLGPKAQRRLLRRDYSLGLSDSGTRAGLGR
jgi:hypothetical protein